MEFNKPRHCRREKTNAKCMKTVDSLLDLMSTTHSSPYENVPYVSVA
jgi:hypothetical protein